MSAGVRTPNVPAARLIEVLGHYDVGGGRKALGRSSLDALIDALRGIISTDPTGVASVRAALDAAVGTLQGGLADEARARVDGLTSEGRTRDAAIRVLTLALEDEAEARVDGLIGEGSERKEAVEALRAILAALSGRVDGKLDIAAAQALRGRDAGLYPFERPGAGPFYFTADAGVKEPQAYVSLDALGVVRSSEGLAYRLLREGWIVSKQFWAIEPDQTCRARCAWVRPQAPGDPNGDTLRFGLLCYDANDAQIADLVLKDWSAAPTGARQTHTGYFSREDLGIEGVQILPAGTRTLRTYIRAFGGQQQTDVQVLSWNGGGSGSGAPGGSAGEAAAFAALARGYRDDTDAIRLATEIIRAATDVIRGRAKDEADRSAASATSAAQVAPNRTYEAMLSELAGNPALPLGTVRQVLSDPNAGTYELRLVSGAKAFVRTGDTVVGLGTRMFRRALRAEVAGTPLLCQGVAQLTRNEATGLPTAVEFSHGERIAGGKPILGPFSSVTGSFDMRAVYGSSLDGSLVMGPRSYRMLLSGDAYADTDREGRIHQGVRGDGALRQGPMEHRASLSHHAGGFLGEAGAPVAVRTAHGVDLEAATFDAWVGTNGQVYAHAYGNTIQVTADPDRTFLKAEVRGGQIVMVRNDNVRFVSPISGACPALPTGTNALLYSDLYGQSNAAANSTGQPIHTASFNGRFLMFGGGQRAVGNWLGHSQERTFLQAPAYDAIHDLTLGSEQLVYAAGETSNSGFAHGILNRPHLPQSAALLTTCSAVGSANVEMLRPDATEAASEINVVGQPWRNLEARFIRARLLSVFLGLTFLAGPLRWNQGEGNIADTRATYLAKLIAIRDGWQALARRWNALWPAAGYGGFAGKAPLITAQTCSGNRYVINGIDYVRSQVPWAQLQICLDDPTAALCIGPTYDQIYAGDGVHLLSAGQEMQGARQAVAWNAWLRGEQYRPLHVRKDAGFAPVRTGTTVRLRIYNHFGLPLTFDTATITGLGADQGFRWFDNGDGNAVTVTGATIVDSATVDLTLSAVPIGTGGGIEIAMTGTPEASAGPATGNRATLRTNGSGITTDGVFAPARAVEHFICIDRVAVS